MEYLIHKQLMAALMLLHITGTLYGAAQEAKVALPLPPGLQKEPAGLIGICASERGNYVLVSSHEKLDTKKEAHYTIVYSEHPELKAGENLARIAATIAAKSYETDTADSLTFYTGIQTICEQEMAAYVTPEIPEISDIVENLSKNRSYGLLAASLKLTPKHVYCTGSHYSMSQFMSDGNMSEAFENRLRKTTVKKLTLSHYMPILTAEKITTDPQTEAERSQGELPESPFHFVVDLDKWLELVAPEEPEEPAKDSFDFAAELEKIGRCIVV